MVFFKPSDEYIDWLVARAAGRLIFDLGSGDGHLTRLLVAKKQPTCGVEPYWYGRDTYDPRLPVIQKPVQICGLLSKFQALVVMARPDHGGWVDWVARYVHPESECLYITRTSNALTGVDLPYETLTELDTPYCTYERTYLVDRAKLRALPEPAGLPIELLEEVWEGHSR